MSYKPLVISIQYSMSHVLALTLGLGRPIFLQSIRLFFQHCAISIYYIVSYYVSCSLRACDGLMLGLGIHICCIAQQGLSTQYQIYLSATLYIMVYMVINIALLIQYKAKHNYLPCVHCALWSIISTLCYLDSMSH